MRILVLGSGGREDAVARSLKKGGNDVYVLPGNGGTAGYAVNIPGSVMDKERVLEAARENDIGYVVVTPDDPLAAGLVDYLSENGFKCFGPDQKASRIESSKVFAKALMKKYSIPTASYEVFTDADEALSYLKGQSLPVVIKADGLALGKGVIIAEDAETAESAVKDMLSGKRFGDAGRRIVIEEFLTGPEVTVLSFTDGKTVVPMVSSMDHKRAWDGDKGPNTGGMGVIAPNPFYTPEIAKECMDTIFLPTIRAMEKEGCPFRGCLYFGLMLTPSGPKVIEYNSRFGDPEAEAVLPLLESDLLSVMMATTEGTLKAEDVSFSDDCSAVVVAASGGYPGSYEKGKVITVGDLGEAELFIAGASLKDGKLVTSGGRVLAVQASAGTLSEALGKAYKALGEISFEKMEYRTDIGRRALS